MSFCHVTMIAKCPFVFKQFIWKINDPFHIENIFHGFLPPLRLNVLISHGTKQLSHWHCGANGEIRLPAPAETRTACL